MGSILPSGDPVTWGLSDITGATGLLHNIISLALLLAGGIAAIFIIWGGYGYLTAYGNDEKAASAKKTITWALIGLFVVILAEFLITQIWGFVTPTPVEFP